MTVYKMSLCSIELRKEKKSVQIRTTEESQGNAEQMREDRVK